MNVTREEIISLAMRADFNGQKTLGDNLRDVAACMNERRVKNQDGYISWKTVDLIEKQMLLEIGDK